MRDRTDLAIMYLLGGSQDLGLAGHNRDQRASGGGGGSGRSRDRDRGRDRGRDRDRRAAAAMQMVGGIAQAIGGVAQAARGGTAAPATTLAPEAGYPTAPGGTITGELGPGGVEVTSPWGKIALGGVLGLVVIGGIVYLVTRKPAAAPAKAA